MLKQHRYSVTSTINHWVTAVLVVVMLALGYTMAGSPSDEVENYVQNVHISIGFFVLLFVFWRVAFRLYEGFPEQTAKKASHRKLASVTHKTLLSLLVLMVITGPMYLFTENECMNVFGWFSICIPLESLNFIHELMEILHVATGLFILPALLVLHFLGAIRHYREENN